MIKKDFGSPDETAHPVERITNEIINIAGKNFYRVTAQPGWRCTVDLKPLLKTDSCQMDHLLYIMAAKMVVQMDDGQQQEFGAGDLASIPPGHDGWGIGNEPTVWLEIPH